MSTDDDTGRPARDELPKGWRMEAADRAVHDEGQFTVERCADPGHVAIAYHSMRLAVPVAVMRAVLGYAPAPAERPAGDDLVERIEKSMHAGRDAPRSVRLRWLKDIFAAAERPQDAQGLLERLAQWATSYDTLQEMRERDANCDLAWWVAGQLRRMDRGERPVPGDAPRSEPAAGGDCFVPHVVTTNGYEETRWTLSAELRAEWSDGDGLYMLRERAEGWRKRMLKLLGEPAAGERGEVERWPGLRERLIELRKPYGDERSVSFMTINAIALELLGEHLPPSGYMRPEHKPGNPLRGEELQAELAALQPEGSDSNGG